VLVAKVLEVPRSSLYVRRSVLAQARQRENVLTDSMVVTAMRKLLTEQPYYQGYGYRRMRAVLRRHFGWNVNHKRLRRLMRQAGLMQQRVRRGHRPAVERPKTATAPNQVWQMDMTKLLLDGYGWLHVIGVIDIFDRQVVGYHISSRARASEWQAAWDAALLNRFPNGLRDHGRLTLQTDNGCQPTSRGFQQHIAVSDARLAYIAPATPEHNAYIERFFRTLKEEEIWPNLYETPEEAKSAIERYIRFYNEERVHSALGYSTPAEFFTEQTQPLAA
jgi:putative transposase